MTFRNLLHLTALALVLFASLGCSQLYNGGYGLKSQDRDAVLAYERAKAERAEKVTQADLQAKRTGPLDFQSGGTNIETGAMPGTGYSAQTVAYRNNARRATGNLGLYGHVPNALGQRTSPLDGINNLRQVTFTTEGADFDPDLDPTGQYLVHASTRHRETSDLYIKTVTGSALRQLTADSGNEVMPAFSPDGTRVAFASDRAGNWDIYIVDVKGGQPVQITNAPTDDIHPCFSRDGQKLIYSTYGSQSGQWELVIVDLNNPAVKRYIGHGLFPAWSPTQDKIVFQRARQRGTLWFSIWTIDLVNGEAMSPTEIAASTNAAAITPEWSPDGRQIVFCTVIDPDADAETMPGPPQADIWLINADGTNRVRLTMGRFSNIQPIWAPSGAIYFTSDRAGEGIENIWSIQPEHAQRMATRPVEPVIAQAPTTAPQAQSQGTEAMVPTE
jgi:TolB protein